VEKDNEEKNGEMIERFFQFLAAIFGKDDMDDLELQERLYLIQYIRAIVSRCLDAQEVGQIPILELTVWATHDGKTNVTIDPNGNPQILQNWALSKLTKRLQDAINAWDFEDIGKKEGKVIDMASAFGWVADKGTAH